MNISYSVQIEIHTFEHIGASNRCLLSSNFSTSKKRVKCVSGKEISKSWGLIQLSHQFSVAVLFSMDQSLSFSSGRPAWVTDEMYM